MSNHTPGPWHIEYPLLDNTSHCAKSGGQMSIQASTGPDVCWIKLYNEWEEYAKANARLIAAAPDMLEALKELIPPSDCRSDWWCPSCKELVDGGSVTFSEHHETCGTFLADCQPDTEWEKKAKAAIAKATGQEESK